MKVKVFKRLSLILFIACILLGTSCKSCKDDGDDNGGTDRPSNTVYYDNENDPIVFSSQEVDKVFNPFFSTSAADGSVVGMTQIGMLGNDKDGEPTYGDDEAVVTKVLDIVSQGSGEDLTTTYYFVLKNNVKFSNGSPLTIKDVFFNLYVYLDPAYTGSSTIYSTDIVGLKEYRTQESDEDEQDSFKVNFQIAAQSRIDALCEAWTSIYDNEKGKTFTVDTFKTALSKYYDENNTDYYSHIVADFTKAVELFKDELNTDFTNSVDTFKDVKYRDENGKLYEGLLTTNVEAFLANEGCLTWNEKDAKLECIFVNDPKELKSWTKDQAIQKVFENKMPKDLEEIVKYWVTAANLNEFIANQEMEEYFKNAGGNNRQYKEISGIKFANRTEPVVVKGVTYDVPTYGANGAPVEGSYEVLSITINDVDPKAIWNFAFSVAPMYYYSDQAHIDAFSFENCNFGVEYASQSFMQNVVKHPDKIGVPVGAGPYAASKSSGGITGITAGDFYSLGVIYYERNPYFVMGPAKIKKLRLQVVAEAQMLNALYNGEIDFVQPNAKPETTNELNSKADQGIGNKEIRTAGYGYIGINAGKIPDMAIRQAIMHSINTQLCVDYYKTTADAIYRPMSKENWAYPDGCTPYYPYIGGKIPENLSDVNPLYAEYVAKLNKKPGDTFTIDEQQKFIKYLVEDIAGYSMSGSGVYKKGNNTTKYTFTIAGQETDHPAWQAMYAAGQFLNQIGFQINVTTDANALKKLSNGELTVWAAAWGSTIDPDMYQVYHKDSNATSVLNWGYKQILLNAGNKYDTELALVETLSEYIELARKTNDMKIRKEIYKEALDIVMQLAIELPTYQRNDLFAYNTNKIDVNSLTPNSELSAYNGLTSDLHYVSLNEEK